MNAKNNRYITTTNSNISFDANQINMILSIFSLVGNLFHTCNKYIKYIGFDDDDDDQSQ